MQHCPHEIERRVSGESQGLLEDRSLVSDARSDEDSVLGRNRVDHWPKSCNVVVGFKLLSASRPSVILDMFLDPGVKLIRGSQEVAQERRLPLHMENVAVPRADSIEVCREIHFFNFGSLFDQLALGGLPNLLDSRSCFRPNVGFDEPKSTLIEIKRLAGWFLIIVESENIGKKLEI